MLVESNLCKFANYAKKGQSGENTTRALVVGIKVLQKIASGQTL